MARSGITLECRHEDSAEEIEQTDGGSPIASTRLAELVDGHGHKPAENDGPMHATDRQEEELTGGGEEQRGCDQKEW